MVVNGELRELQESRNEELKKTSRVRRIFKSH